MNIKQLRTEHNLSQTELAEMLGVTMRTVRNWEKGEPPKMAKLALQTIEREIGKEIITEKKIKDKFDEWIKSTYTNGYWCHEYTSDDLLEAFTAGSHIIENGFLRRDYSREQI